MSDNQSPEEYVIKGFELVWPDPKSMDRFKPEARKIIIPFLDYIHSGPEYARDTPHEKEALLLEKAAVDINRTHTELVTFCWIPGFPRTIIALVPQLLEEEAPDMAAPVAEFWEMYKDDDDALTAFREIGKRAKTWALMRLDCTTQMFWDSEERNLGIPLCLGQPCEDSK